MAEYLPRALASKPPSMMNSSPHPNSKTNKENQFVPLRKLSNASSTVGEDVLKNRSQNITGNLTQRRGSSPALNEMSFHPENTLKNNRSESPDFLFEKYDNLSQSDIKLLHKEMATLKKALNESQARSVFATKELSKIQYENAALQLQVKKAESKCKDMIEKHTNSQVRINELTFINNQLNSENAKLKANAHGNSNETKEDLNKLRKSLIQIEDLIQTKNGQVIQHTKNIQKILDILQKLLEGCNVSLYPKFQASFMQTKQYLQKILKVVDVKYIEGLDERIQEFDAVKSLNEVIVAYEKENGELANEVLRLNEMLEQEKMGYGKLTPTYKDALYKLKDAVNIVKNKLKDIQKSKQVEKEYYEGKIQKLREGRDALTQENKALRNLTQSLEAKLKDSDDQVRVLKERGYNDNVKHPQGIKTPWARGSYKPENKNEVEPGYYRNSYNPNQVLAERDGDYVNEKDIAAASKMYIDGLTERRGSWRNSVGVDVNNNWSSQQRNKAYYSGAKRVQNANEEEEYAVKPVNSWREYRKGGDTFRGDQGDYPGFGKGEAEMLDQAEDEDRMYKRDSDKGLRNQIHVLDDEIHRLEECIREELATNEDFAF